MAISVLVKASLQQSKNQCKIDRDIFKLMIEKLVIKYCLNNEHAIFLCCCTNLVVQNFIILNKTDLIILYLYIPTYTVN